jgi:L-malate glycosyltransferase
MSLGAVDGRAIAREAQPVRVVQFLAAFAMGGTERQAMNLALGLDPSRFDLRFACFRVLGDFLADIETARKPLTMYAIDRLYGGKTLRQQLRFARDLRSGRIDVVNAYGFYANVFAVPTARLAGVRVVVASIRDTGDHLTPAQRRVQRLACGLADAILVNAQAVKRRLVDEGYGDERITVIGNGVALSRFGPRDGAGRRRREMGFAADAPLVAVFCRLNRLKGVEHFVEAAASVAKWFPRARFAVVGEGRVLQNGVAVESSYKRELRAQAARLGLGDRLVFTGLRDDVPELLAEVAVSVLPSLSEGLSNTILESMAAGVPVVATDVGGNAEAVQDGVTGRLVPPRDAGALASAIAGLLEDGALADRFGRAGRQRVVERFSDEKMVRDTEKFYLSLLARKGSRAYAVEASEGTA